MFNLLTGKRMLNKGRGSAHTFSWEDYNIPLPTPRKNPGYTYESGILRVHLLGFLQLIANDESPVAPLLNEQTIKVVPVSMAKDGMTLKPGFQADSRQMIVIVGLERYTLEYITENQLASPEFFKDKFITEAEIMGITTVDYKLAIVLGCDFVNNSGTGQSKFEKHLKRLKELQQCKSCLEGDEGVIVTGESCETVHVIPHAQKIDPCAMNAKLRVIVIGIPCCDSAMNVWKVTHNVYVWRVST